MESNIISILLFLVVGGIIGYVTRMAFSLSKQKSMEITVKKASIEAKEKAQIIIDKAEKKKEEFNKELRQMEKEQRELLQKSEDRIVKKEENLERKQHELEREKKALTDKIEEVKELKKKVAAVREDKLKELETVANLTKEEAISQMNLEIEKSYEEDLLIRIKKMETVNKERMDDRARDILLSAIQRLSSSTASDVTTTNVTIPSDDMKGKIIGKEGRNIRAFEHAAGVELIVDDTPGVIIISCFDPVRRQIARVALENLLLDGRIQPVKIEEFIKAAGEDISRIIKKKGEEAVHEVGILDFDTRIVGILGRLYFRTSYGQNVLQHSIEMAHVAGMLAEELGANVQIAKAGALVHDIGKALDHEMQGGHIKIGMRILEKFGADKRIIDAMKSHHDDFPHESMEAIIVQTADMISGSRPGARRDTVENYIKRLEDLENVANGFDGVDKVYALQAGREVRVFVNPLELSDLESAKLAKDVAHQIEQELRYPGEIKVTIIRENRITEYAR